MMKPQHALLPTQLKLLSALPLTTSCRTISMMKPQHALLPTQLKLLSALLLTISCRTISMMKPQHALLPIQACKAKLATMIPISLT